MPFRKRGKQTVPQVNGLATNVCMYNATCEALWIKMYMCIQHCVQHNVNLAPCIVCRSSSSPVGWITLNFRAIESFVVYNRMILYIGSVKVLVKMTNN